jgi:Cyclic nucleotide-binding domain
MLGTPSEEAMRLESTVMSVSWIPSESLSGPLRVGIDLRLAHYDAPPPETLQGPEEVRRLRDEDRFRFANVLSGWIDVEDGRIMASGSGDDLGLVMGSTTIRVASFEATFRGFSLPVMRPEPEQDADRVRFTQTVGGRTSVPLPGPVPHPPFVRWQAPVVWTTLALTLHADGRSAVELIGASAFPRHWVYGPDGRLTLKSGLTDQAAWVAHSFGPRTPWGDQDSPALVTAAESQLERQMSHEIMRGDHKPVLRSFPAGATLTKEGEPGDELFLLLDGVLAVEVQGERLAEVGPGAVLGERALLEGGLRTSTLVTVTPVRVAAAASDTIDLERLRTLAQSRRREELPRDLGQV